MAAATSSGCISFFNLRSSSSSSTAGPRGRKAPAVHGSSTACGRIDRVAMLVINGMAAVFFASLEHCSCIRIATVEDVDEGNEISLIQNDANNNLNYRDAGRVSTHVRLRPIAGRGKKSGASVEED